MSDDNENIYFTLPEDAQSWVDELFNPRKSHCPTCKSPLTTLRTTEYIGEDCVSIDKPGYYFVVRQKCLNPDCPFEAQLIDGEAPADEIRQ